VAPHNSHVWAGGDAKRRDLRALGYRIVAIKTTDMAAGLEELKSKL